MITKGILLYYYNKTCGTKDIRLSSWCLFEIYFWVITFGIFFLLFTMEKVFLIMCKEKMFLLMIYFPCGFYNCNITRGSLRRSTTFVATDDKVCPIREKSSDYTSEIFKMTRKWLLCLNHFSSNTYWGFYFKKPPESWLQKQLTSLLTKWFLVH